ncbi:hypothetical protein J3R83DRAFT_241 [Lanmaoa asiatica]|nr:hypothetical protein J3R83DRAFT_241 [Lanmaoa asiatica]
MVVHVHILRYCPLSGHSPCIGLLDIQRKRLNVAISTTVILSVNVRLIFYGRGVAVDKFANLGVFVSTVVGDSQSLRLRCGHVLIAYILVIMAMRIYAMYLGSKIVLTILVAIILARIGVGLAVAVVIFGPRSGISAIEWVLSGIYVCGPIVNTTSSLPFAWDILAIVVNSLLFLLAVGCFIKHALNMRQMLHAWKVSDLMGVLARDSIVYFFCTNLLSTILLMISVWGLPNNPLFFAVISAYTTNETSVLIPRLVISFRENYDADGQPSQHGANTARRTIRSEKMVFGRRTMMTDDFEMQTVDQTQQPRVEESA